MNSMSKLHFLFVKHLRTIYHGEKLLGATWMQMSKTTTEPDLQHLFKIRAGEQGLIVATLGKIFRLLHTDGDGETDPIIQSFIPVINTDDAGYNPAWTAMIISGRGLSIYRSNALETAISTAEDLGMFEVAELLGKCPVYSAFDRNGFEFLKSHLEYSAVPLPEFEAA